MNEYGEGAEKSAPGLISHEESGKPAEAAPRPEPEQSRNWKTPDPADPFIICQLADVRRRAKAGALPAFARGQMFYDFRAGRVRIGAAP